MNHFVKRFLLTLRYSLIPHAPEYKKFRTLPIKSSLLYLLTLIFLINALFASIYLFKIRVHTWPAAYHAILFSFETFPKDLIITIENGTLSTSFNRPVFFFIRRDKEPRSFLVIDQTLTRAQTDLYSAPVLLGKDELVIHNPLSIGPRLLTITHPQEKRFIFDEKDSARLKAFARRYATPLFISLLLIVYILLPLFVYVTALVFLAAAAYGAYALLHLRSPSHTLKASFQLTLHGATLPLLIIYAICSLAPSLKAFAPFAFTFLIFVFAAAAVYEGYYDK